MTSAPSDRDRFTRWARQSLVPLRGVASELPRHDLKPLGEMIGDATVVSLSESVHCAAEPLEFRNRVLQFLVEKKGFTAVAIESGIVESRLVHDYVRGGPGDLQTVLSEGISWNFDQLPQNRALVQWLREYNVDPRHTGKINFYGFDVPGSPANAKAQRGVDTALVETMKYLAGVDCAAADLLRKRLNPVMSYLRFDLRGRGEWGYERLTGPERDAITATVADLISVLERNEAQYIVATTSDDYEWAYRAAIGARQVDAWLRRMPTYSKLSSESAQVTEEQIGPLMAAADVRDRAQADNLDWILGQEGPSGKILIFAARYHLCTTPVRARFWGMSEEREQQVAGTYLRRRLGERLVTIGNCIGRGEVECGDFRDTVARAPRETFDAVAGDLGTALYLLDLRTTPPALTRWLNEEHWLYNPPHEFRCSVGQAFDLIFYIDTVTPAVAASR